MKEAILTKIGNIFMKFGFKSVTMDDIANDLAMSKKTLYKYFKNKEDLVAQTVTHIHRECICKIESICELGHNAIAENFEVKRFFRDMFKSSDDSPMYQLEKYYPQIYHSVLEKEFEAFQECILKNLDKGVKQGLYRKNINKSIVVRFYFALVFSIHDRRLFKHRNHSLKNLEIDALEYHTRAIATEKGIKELEKQLIQFN